MSRLADQSNSIVLAVQHLCDDIPTCTRVHPQIAKLRGERCASGDGFQAAEVPAATDDVVVVGQMDVADVAGRAVRASVHAAVGDDARAHPLPTLTNRRNSSSRQFDQYSPRAMMFTSLSTMAGAENRSPSRSPTG